VLISSAEAIQFERGKGGQVRWVPEHCQVPLSFLINKLSLKVIEAHGWADYRLNHIDRTRQEAAAIS